MAGTFKLALKFNEDISGWNTASVLDMSSMFESAFDFNRPGLGSAVGDEFGDGHEFYVFVGEGVRTE